MNLCFKTVTLNILQTQYSFYILIDKTYDTLQHCNYLLITITEALKLFYTATCIPMMA